MVIGWSCLKSLAARCVGRRPKPTFHFQPLGERFSQEEACLVEFIEFSAFQLRYFSDYNYEYWKWAVRINVGGAATSAALAVMPIENPWGRLASSAPAIAAAVAAGLSAAMNYRDEHIRQAFTCSHVYREIAKFKSGVAPYKGADRLEMLSRNCFAILDLETAKWAEFWENKRGGEGEPARED